MAADLDCIEVARHLTGTTHFVSDFCKQVDPTLLLPDLHISEEHKEEVTNICIQKTKYAACQKLWEYLRREVGWPQDLATALERSGRYSALLTVLVTALPNHCRRGARANAAGAPQAAAPRRRNRNRRAGGAARPPPPDALRQGAVAPGNGMDRNPAAPGLLPAADLPTPLEAQPQLQLEPRYPVEEERGPYRGIEEQGWVEPSEKVIYSRQSPWTEVDPGNRHAAAAAAAADADDDDDEGNDDKDDDKDDSDGDDPDKDKEEKDGITVGDILKQAARAGCPASPLESAQITCADDLQAADDETIVLHSDDEENSTNTNGNAAVQPPLSLGSGNDSTAPQYPSQGSTIDLQLHRQRPADQGPFDLRQCQQGNQSNNAPGMSATGNGSSETSMSSIHVNEALRAHQPTGSSIASIDRQPASPPVPTSMANPGNASALAEAFSASNFNLATVNSSPSAQSSSSTPSISIHPGRASNHTNVSPTTEDSGLSPPRPSPLSQMLSSFTSFFNSIE